MPDAEFIVLYVLCLVVIGVHVGPGLLKSRHLARREKEFSDLGISVEVDCRKCGQFNRVPSYRLRDRPKCGRCKERLMPKRRVVFCRTYPMEGVMRVELDALWKDEDRLWQCLADHAVIEAKVRAEARGDQPRTVN